MAPSDSVVERKRVVPVAALRVYRCVFAIRAEGKVSRSCQVEVRVSLTSCWAKGKGDSVVLNSSTLCSTRLQNLDKYNYSVPF